MMKSSAVHKSIDELNAREWNALGGDRNPFLRHEFFAALEHTDCIGNDTGWTPCYFTLKDGTRVCESCFVKGTASPSSRDRQSF